MIRETLRGGTSPAQVSRSPIGGWSGRGEKSAERTRALRIIGTKRLAFEVGQIGNNFDICGEHNLTAPGKRLLNQIGVRPDNVYVFRRLVGGLFAADYLRAGTRQRFENALRREGLRATVVADDKSLYIYPVSQLAPPPMNGDMLAGLRP